MDLTAVNKFIPLKFEPYIYAFHSWEISNMIPKGFQCKRSFIISFSINITATGLISNVRR